MTDYVCLKPDACKAVTPGKICKSCFMIQRNSSQEMKAFLSKTRKGINRFNPETSHSPEANAKRTSARLYTLFPWLHEDYRALYSRIRKSKIPMQDRQAIVADQIATDRKRFDALAARLDKFGESMFELRMAASHDRMKRGGTVLYRK